MVLIASQSGEDQTILTHCAEFSDGCFITTWNELHQTTALGTAGDHSLTWGMLPGAALPAISQPGVSPGRQVLGCWEVRELWVYQSGVRGGRRRARKLRVRVPSDAHGNTRRPGEKTRKAFKGHNSLIWG